MLFPLTEPGVAGIELTVIAKVCDADEPQALLAETEIVPPDAFDVEEIVFVDDEPDQPTGNAQLYEVAPLTVAIL